MDATAEHSLVADVCAVSTHASVMDATGMPHGLQLDHGVSTHASVMDATTENAGAAAVYCVSTHASVMDATTLQEH